MAGQLDSLFKNAAKSVVSQLGTSQDYSISVPIAFIRSEEDEGKEIRQAKMYITPDLIGDNQIDFDDEVQFSYAGSTVTGQIYDIDTKKGGQVYLYTILVRF